MVFVKGSQIIVYIFKILTKYYISIYKCEQLSKYTLPKSILIGFFVLCEKYCVVFECIFSTRLSKPNLQLHAQS